MKYIVTLNGKKYEVEVIMAIVSHETGIPLSELIFKTIKAI